MYCEQCGTEIPDDALFCSQCGLPVDRDYVELELDESVPSDSGGEEAGDGGDALGGENAGGARENGASKVADEATGEADTGQARAEAEVEGAGGGTQVGADVGGDAERAEVPDGDGEEAGGDANGAAASADDLEGASSSASDGADEAAQTEQAAGPDGDSPSSPGSDANADKTLDADVEALLYGDGSAVAAPIEEELDEEPGVEEQVEFGDEEYAVEPMNWNEEWPSNVTMPSFPDEPRLSPIVIVSVGVIGVAAAVMFGILACTFVLRLFS